MNNRRPHEKKSENCTLSQPLKSIHVNGQCVSPSPPVSMEDHEEEESAVVEVEECGIGPCRNEWLQRFANKKVFVAVFCLVYILQGMFYTYFVSILTTIEKLFQIQSKVIGIIMSATEMGQIGGALLLTYYGGQGHRPRWIACGMILFACASFLSSLPHFLYGNQMVDSLQSKMDVSQVPLHLCANASGPMANLTAAADEESCLDDENGKRNPSSLVLGILFVSLLFIGIGQTAVHTLGIPYIDDNVANRDSPLYFAITIGVRILGPVFGFLLGSVCTKLYVNPFEEISITNKDPRWIGAWWLGPLIVAGGLAIVSIAMLAFPRRLPGQRNSSHNMTNGHAHVPLAITGKDPVSEEEPGKLIPQTAPTDTAITKHRDFTHTVKRLLKNKILLLRTASTVLHLLPISGMYNFLPKYLESQFRQTSTNASLISALAGVLVMGVGIFASGTIMRRCKPNARFVAGWIAIVALAYSIGMTILMFVGCPIKDFAGLEERSKNSLIGAEIQQQLSKSGLDISPPCNTSCECDTMFAPVCSNDQQMFYSACYAGCKNYTIGEVNGEKQNIYHECECLGKDVIATHGNCGLDCDNFIWYIFIFSISGLIHSTSEVGAMLLTLRCVDPKDKAMALGLISFAIGLFGNVPCPIIYGAVIDSACLVWEYTCGVKGACRFYDPAVFRTSFYGMTGAIMFLAFIVDVVVWYKARSIRFTDEEITKTEEEHQPINSSVSTQFQTTL